jgi:hypothetical protein
VSGEAGPRVPPAPRNRKPRPTRHNAAPQASRAQVSIACAMLGRRSAGPWIFATPGGRIRAWGRGGRSAPIWNTCRRCWQHEAAAPARVGYQPAGNATIGYETL